MQLVAKLIQVLPLQSGTGKNGQWKKQDIIVETEGQYPKKICVSIWGDKIDERQLQINNVLKLEFEVESREFNGKWYTDVKAWKIDMANAGNASGSTSSVSSKATEKVENDFLDSAPMPTEDDLPF